MHCDIISDVMTAEDRQGLVSSEEQEEDGVDIFHSPVHVRPESQSPGLVYVASASAAPEEAYP